MDSDVYSLGIAAVALVGVVLEYLMHRRDYGEHKKQMGLMARQVRATEEMVRAQDRVISELAEAQRQRSAIWDQEVKRRKQKDELDKVLSIWDQARDFLDF